MRGGALALLGLLLVLLLFPAASGQAQREGCQEPIITLSHVPDTIEPGESYSLLFAVENPNGPRVDAVRATITTSAPAGWSAIPAQRDITLGPRNVSFDVLAITAPNRGTGEAAGNITLAVTFVCTSGDVQTSASTSVGIPVRIAEFRAPWPIVLGAFIILAGGVGLLGVRRLRRGVALVATTPERPVVPGKSAKFTFAVENRRGKPQRLAFLATGLPEGWSIHLALPEVDLEPGEEKTLWAIVKAPATAEPGTAVPFTIRLEAAPPGREWASVDVVARVQDFE